MACGHTHRHSGSPQPSFRLAPESRACSHIHHHSGSPNRHSGESRNLWRAVTYTVIPPPPTVIPALPTVIPAKAGIYARRPITDSPNCHSGSPNRHSGESRNLCPPTPLPSPPTVIPPLPTVIPAQAGIYARRPITDSPNRHTDSLNRHSGESRNLCPKEPLPPAPAKFPISQSNLPAPQRRPQSGHTSGIPLAPHASHCQGDPAPSRFAPLPGILDVGDSGSRFGCPQRAPSALPNPKSRKIPQNDDTSYLTLMNSSAILSPIR